MLLRSLLDTNHCFYCSGTVRAFRIEGSIPESIRAEAELL